MSSDLRWKFILIAIIILICIFGVVGMPEFPTSANQLKQNLADRIKLGLDLKGGSHLVLQVQVDEAIGQRCDETIDAMTKQLHEKNVNVGEIRRVDDTHILVRNVDPTTSATFRDIVSTQFQDWTISPAPGEQNGYLLAMKPSVVADIRRNVMDQSLDTITRRINALGLTEPTIAFTGRGDNEILVQLPGEADPTRAKAVIQATGQLSLNLVVDEQHTHLKRLRLPRTAASFHPERKSFPANRALSPVSRHKPSITLSIALPSSPDKTCEAKASVPVRISRASIRWISSFLPRRPAVSVHSRRPTLVTGWPSSSIIKFIRRRRSTGASMTQE